MPSTKERFWAKVLFKEFIKHYRKFNAEQKAADIDESMDALEDLNPNGESFGAKMVRWSLERADDPFAVAARENGKKGGRPRTSAMPRNTQELYDRATRLGVDHADARDCYEATKARGGKDADGNNVTNFDGYLMSWGKTAEANRRKNG